MSDVIKDTNVICIFISNCDDAQYGEGWKSYNNKWFVLDNFLAYAERRWVEDKGGGGANDVE